MTESERTTRRERIDPKLKAAGWPAVEYFEPTPRDVAAVCEQPTSNRPADYVFSDYGQVIGAVEAKKLTVGPPDVLTQAERYLRGIETGKKYHVELVRHSCARQTARSFGLLLFELKRSAAVRAITARDANRKELEKLKKYVDEHMAGTGRFPKRVVSA